MSGLDGAYRPVLGCGFFWDTNRQPVPDSGTDLGHFQLKVFSVIVFARRRKCVCGVPFCTSLTSSLALSLFFARPLSFSLSLSVIFSPCRSLSLSLSLALVLQFGKRSLTLKFADRIGACCHIVQTPKLHTLNHHPPEVNYLPRFEKGDFPGTL